MSDAGIWVLAGAVVLSGYTVAKCVGEGLKRVTRALEKIDDRITESNIAQERTKSRIGDVHAILRGINNALWEGKPGRSEDINWDD